MWQMVPHCFFKKQRHFRAGLGMVTRIMTAKVRAKVKIKAMIKAMIKAKGEAKGEASLTSMVTIKDSFLPIFAH